MSIPCNPTDFKRFEELAELLATVHPPVDLSLYVSKDTKGDTVTYYVSLEIKGSLNAEEVYKVFKVDD